MKFRQKIVLFLVIVVVDLILCGVTLRMWKGEDGEKDFKGDVYHERNKEENESEEQEDRKDRNVMSRESDMVREKETDMRKYVALTFDDGPNSRYTKPLLDRKTSRKVLLRSQTATALMSDGFGTAKQTKRRLEERGLLSDRESGGKVEIFNSRNTEEILELSRQLLNM